MKFVVLPILMFLSGCLFAQNNQKAAQAELKVFTASQCFECMSFEEMILLDPYFQTYASSSLQVTIHHEDSLEAQKNIFELYNSDNIYPTIVLVKHHRNDFIRIPYNGMRAEDFVYLINKLRR
jgi:hypothetical protein